MAKKNTPKHIFHVALQISVGVLLITAFNGAALPSSRTSGVTKPAEKQLETSSPSKPVSPPVTPPTPQPVVTTLAPPVVAAPTTKTPVPTAITKPIVTTAAKPAPVVTPVPNSDVSGLTPATPTATPAPVPDTTGSNGSGASSSQTQTTSYTSTNWSGYLAASGTFTAISGQWVVPTVTGNGATITADSTWIGIGGVSSNDLIQIGTSDTVSASGTVASQAFFELLPAVSQPVPGVTVSVGDSIKATITQTSPGQWTFYLLDQTTGQSYLQSVSYTSSNSSAEWIEEDPSYANGHQIPFDNYGQVHFTTATTTLNGVPFNLLTSNAQPVTMVTSRSGTVVSSPSAIGSDETSFDVTHS